LISHSKKIAHSNGLLVPLFGLLGGIIIIIMLMSISSDGGSDPVGEIRHFRIDAIVTG
jgi:hypothetical protein